MTHPADTQMRVFNEWFSDTYPGIVEGLMFGGLDDWRFKQSMLAAFNLGLNTRAHGEAVAWQWEQRMHDSMGGWESKTERRKPGTWVRPEDIRDLRPLFTHPAASVVVDESMVELALKELLRVIASHPFSSTKTNDAMRAALTAALQSAGRGGEVGK